MVWGTGEVRRPKHPRSSLPAPLSVESTTFPPFSEPPACASMPCVACWPVRLMRPLTTSSLRSAIRALDGIMIVSLYIATSITALAT